MPKFIHPTGKSPPRIAQLIPRVGLMMLQPGEATNPAASSTPAGALGIAGRDAEGNRPSGGTAAPHGKRQHAERGSNAIPRNPEHFLPQRS